MQRGVFGGYRIRDCADVIVENNYRECLDEDLQIPGIKRRSSLGRLEQPPLVGIGSCFGPIGRPGLVQDVAYVEGHCPHADK